MFCLFSVPSLFCSFDNPAGHPVSPVKRKQMPDSFAKAEIDTAVIGLARECSNGEPYGLESLLVFTHTARNLKCTMYMSSGVKMKLEDHGLGHICRETGDFIFNMEKLRIWKSN